MRYEALQYVTVLAGALVKLTKEQAARTRGLTKPSEEHKGWSEVLHPFGFKAGEHVETDQEFGKGNQAVKVIDPKNPVAKPTREQRAEANAKADAAAEAQRKADAEHEAKRLATNQKP